MVEPQAGSHASLAYTPRIDVTPRMDMPAPRWRVVLRHGVASRPLDAQREGLR